MLNVLINVLLGISLGAIGTMSIAEIRLAASEGRGKSWSLILRHHDYRYMSLSGHARRKHVLTGKQKLLGTDMYVQDSLIEGYLTQSKTIHRPVQRQRRTGVIQTTRLVYHILIKLGCDLVRVAIVHGPHRANHGTESGELHGCSKMDDLVRTLLVSNGRMTSR